MALSGTISCLIDLEKASLLQERGFLLSPRKQANRNASLPQLLGSSGLTPQGGD
jgi:hypothetical protein